MLIIACNLGLPGSAARIHTPVENNAVRPLPQIFYEGMAMSYSGYRAGQSPGTSVYPAANNIRDDLKLLKAMGFNLIRLYDTSEHARRTLEMIKTTTELTPDPDNPDNLVNMKVMLGIWISGPHQAFGGANEAAIRTAVGWATDDYKDQIVAISVGNETMVDWNTFGWSTPPADIAYYVSYVRDQVHQPVTVNDNWEAWSLKNEDPNDQHDHYKDVHKVAEAVDFISLHSYPIADAPWDLWDWQEPSGPDAAANTMDRAFDRLEENYNDARTALIGIGIDKPIVIGETGWKSQGTTLPLSHGVNQELYYKKIESWIGRTTDNSKPATAFFFEAFDEPWKRDDDDWGLFNVDREAKYIVYSNSTWMNALTPLGVTVADTPRLTADDAISVAPPTASTSSTPLTISAAEFVVFADVPGDAATAYNGQLYDGNDDGTASDVNFQWAYWDSNTGEVSENTAAGNGGSEGGGTETVAVLTPTANANRWGWGIMALMENQGYDLRGFATGFLKFRIKTAYQGKIEIGLQTGLGEDGDGKDMLIKVTPGDPAGNYGYSNDNTWREVTIPINTLVAAATSSHGASGTAGLEKVHIPFVIADRGLLPGNDGYNTGTGSEIWIDWVRWTKTR